MTERDHDETQEALAMIRTALANDLKPPHLDWLLLLAVRNLDERLTALENRHD